MNLIHTIKNEADLRSVRDHFGKVFQEKMSLPLGISKLNNRTAEMLGATDWNTALSIVRQKNSKPETQDPAQIYRSLVLTYITAKLDFTDMETLVGMLAHSIFKRPEEDYARSISTLEQMSHGSLGNLLSLLKEPLDFFDDYYRIIGTFGIYKDDFVSFVKTGALKSSVSKNVISEEASELSMESLSPNNAYNLSHLTELVKKTIETELKNIPVYLETTLLDDDLLQIDLYQPKKNGENSSIEGRLFILSKSNPDKLSFDGRIGVFDDGEGDFVSPTCEFDSKSFSILNAPSDISKEAFDNIYQTMKRIISLVEPALQCKYF